MYKRQAQCNLVCVSSILPEGCTERKRTNIPTGSITFTVLARKDGYEGTTIGAGIAWAWAKDFSYGIVAETHGYMDKTALLEILEWKIKEMAKIREIEINGIKYRTEFLRVPMDSYGCVVAALVYLP